MRQQNKYRFYYDDGHGWLEVPNVDVKASGITVTPYSYYNPKTDMVYLEEDEDMPNFLEAIGKGVTSIGSHVNSSMPRELPHIK
jgi:hypothetical protein